MTVARMPDTDQEVARRAYALWEAEGRPHGRDREHWERAQRDAAVPDAPGAAAVDATDDSDGAATIVASAPKKRRAPARTAQPAAVETGGETTGGETVAPTRKPARRRTAKPEA